MRPRGFTLIEMAVTVFLFGVIGVLAIQLLSQSVRATDKIISRGHVLNEWHRAMTILEQDFLQLSHRAIRNDYGDLTPSLLMSNPGEIEFTRLGWQNPLSHQRSDQQRVLYFLLDRQLIRRYWSVLDRSVEAPFIDQVLLSNVDSVNFLVIDRGGRDYNYWPAASDVSIPSSITSAVAIQMSIELAQLGQISQIWLIPERVPLRHSPADQDDEDPNDREATAI